MMSMRSPGSLTQWLDLIRLASVLPFQILLGYGTLGLGISTGPQAFNA
jgi:hypothetical protein